ncbi:MAG: thymidine phosphorylase [Gemmatimonadota bacterium]|jgi:pyrimidine-nucleoside phosphorylase
MSAYRTVQRKRDGEELTPAEIETLLGAYGDGRVGDPQMAAFLMAVWFRGLSAAELSTVVDVMLHSGAVVRLDDVPGIKVDKHSTGGVGDKVSLVLAPLVASLGVPVPMMSGRSLGHSGGTLDKLESIPGFRTDLSLAEYRAQVERIGCALIGQTDELVPLDRRLYALRDATATVESIPLIASSIMSKKLAEGIDALVLDVKTGNGAFMREPERAVELARTMIGIGRARGCDVVARLTAMDRPLGVSAGNAVEVAEAVEALRGKGPADLREVTVTLAAEMLMLAGAAADGASAARLAESALDDGRAFEKMREIVGAQGGDTRVLDAPEEVLPRARIRRAVAADREGVVSAMDVRAIGLACMRLGAGRDGSGGAIDPAVGLLLPRKPGDAVRPGDELAVVLGNDETKVAEAARALRAAIPLGDESPPTLPLVMQRITADGAGDA